MAKDLAPLRNKLSLRRRQSRLSLRRLDNAGRAYRAAERIYWRSVVLVEAAEQALRLARMSNGVTA